LGTNKLQPIRDKQIIAILSSIVILFFTVSCALYELLNSQSKVFSPNSADRTSITQQKGRILVILIDSLQKDAAFSDHMPFISQSRNRGAWGISEVVSTPLSIAGDHAIFAGIMASPFAIIDDFHPGTATHNNIFKRMSAHGKQVVLFGSLISNAYGDYTDNTAYKPHTFAYSEYGKAAGDIFQQAYAYLKENNWDFAVVQFVSLDHVGHLHTPASKEYLDALRLFDDYVKKLVDLTSDEDVVLITSEHGMDNRGFHADRMPLVIETPFILTGKWIKRGGPYKLLQIDWAPTLSVLAGVSPFYPSPALPAIDLITGLEDQHAFLIKEFSKIYTAGSEVSTIEGLRHERLKSMVRQPSFSAGFIMILGSLLSLMLLAYAALSNPSCQLTRDETIAVPCCIILIAAMAILASKLEIPNALSQQLPFSANFMMDHPFITFAILMCAAVIGKLLLYIPERTIKKKFVILFLFTFGLSLIFLADNPYHPLNWLILSFPLMGFFAGQKNFPEWLVVFFCIWAGLGIRRLTFYDAHSAIDLPDRWLLASFMFLFSIIFLWFRIRRLRGKTCSILAGITCFAPAIMVIAYPMSVQWKALLLASLLPVLWIKFKEPMQRQNWMALWVVFFYLGTSSSLENTVHLAIFPLLLAVWSLANKSSSIGKGIILSFILWIFYLLPGNAFELKIQDAADSYLMGSVVDEEIAKTVSVIAARYILPAAILIWGIIYRDNWSSKISTLATALLPLFFGIGASFTTMIFTPSIGVPWEGFGRLTVLSCYFLVLMCAFLLASFPSNRLVFANKYRSSCTQ